MDDEGRFIQQIALFVALSLNSLAAGCGDCEPGPQTFIRVDLTDAQRSVPHPLVGRIAIGGQNVAFDCGEEGDNENAQLSGPTQISCWNDGFSVVFVNEETPEFETISVLLNVEGGFLYGSAVADFRISEGECSASRGDSVDIVVREVAQP